MNLDEIDQLEPTANDFRRVGKGVPMVRDATTGKLVRYRRSSSVGKILDDESGLTDWKIRTIIEGAAQRPDLMAMASTFDHEANKRELRDIAEQCLVTGKGTQRATTGTAIHSMLDHVDAEHDWQPAPQFAEVVNAYVAVRDANGLVPIDIECKCVNDQWRLAGTMDRRYRTTRTMIAPDGTVIPIGSVLAGDTKTGRTLEYASGVYATQMAAYVDSVRYDPLTDERTPFDPPTYPDWGLIVHLSHDDGTCVLHWVDLEAGRLGLRLADEVYGWRRRTDLITPARAALAAVPVEAVEDDPPPVAASDPITPLDGPTEANEAMLADVREWLRERVAAIVALGGSATAMLQRVWPANVPGLKQTGHTETQLDAIAIAVGLVETEYQMPWQTLDPRKVAAPSETWVKGLPSTDAQRDELARSILTHPRKELLQRWSALGMQHLDPAIVDRTALTHALYEFALVNSDWSDDDVTEMLDGTLRAVGYSDGIAELGHVAPEHAPLIMTAAFALATDTALLVYDEDGKPYVRVITETR